MPFDPGTYAGHYELLGLIGAGGMGEVYKARDTHLHRTVAVKVLPAQLADNPDRVARFAHEARTASALNHPNIVTIHEIGDIAGAPYLVMELVEGQTLRRLMTEGAIDARRTLDIATQVADGLAKAHAAGIVHRDLKPENIMVTEDGFAKILDFGLAKLRGDAAERVDETVTQTAPRTVAGTILGTVGYMSPEQAAGRPVAVQSDQFALGTIVYEMATGRRAFERDSAVQTLAAIIEDEPEPIAALSPAFPESARQIVERCLSKDPDARYGSTLDLARELRGVREQLSQSATAGPQKRAKAEAAWMGRSRRLPALAVVAALLTVAIVSAALYFSRGHVESIAVLPFKNLTGDSTQEYFVDGITDGLIGHLGRVSALRVLSFYSVMRYKEGKTPLAQVAQTLNADTLVEGSVQEVGSNVSVRVRLISPRPEERTLWEGTYSRTITDTFVMYGDVVRAISRELDVPLQASEEARLTQPRQVNPKTYQAYLRGMFLLNGSTDEEFEQGLSILEQAVRDDPGDPLTYVGLADAYVTLGHGPTSTPDAWQRARQAAQRALRIDPNLAEAYANLADVKLYYERDWKGAEQNFKRAMELNANLPMNHYHYAWYLALFSRWDEAIAEHKRAQELDPLTPLHTGWLGGLYWYVGRYDEALREAGKCLKLRNRSALGWLITGYAHVEQGHFDEAIAAHQKAVAISPDWRYALARSYAMAGKREEARKIEVELEREKPSDFGAWGLAVVATALGEHDKAFKWLDYQPAHGWVPWCRVDPQFRPLRNDPRFKALLRKFNLPDVNDRSS